MKARSGSDVGRRGKEFPDGSLQRCQPTSYGNLSSATATDDAGNTSEFSPDISIKGVTDLVVSIDASPNPVGIGGTLTYTVAVANTGTLDAHDVVLTDQLPYQIAPTSVSASQGSPPVLDTRSRSAWARLLPATRPR